MLTLACCQCTNNNINYGGYKMKATLKDLRETQGISQMAAASLIGVSVNAYRMWEQGGGKPNAANMAKLVKLFGDEVKSILCFKILD